MIQRIRIPSREAIIQSVRAYVPVREPGQGMVEYAVILAGIAILAIAAVAILGPKIKDAISGIQLS